jgi:hypothetical protein
MVLALAIMARREHKKLRASRRSLLDHCVHVLSDAVITHGDDDFPRLDGRYNGSRVRVELIPDTMTMRRLPQLWLTVAVTAPRPGMKGFAALVRPNGSEFYALAHRLSVRLETPGLFPAETLINADAPDARHLLEALAPTAASLLADPRVKELAVTAKGTRIVRQAGEGRRGEYLLLRQSVFDDAHVQASDLEAILQATAALRRAVPSEPRAVAA